MQIDYSDAYKVLERIRQMLRDKRSVEWSAELDQKIEDITRVLRIVIEADRDVRWQMDDMEDLE